MLQSFFSTWWVSIFPCVGYNLSVPHKIPEESRIRSCSSEVSDNLNLFSIKLQRIWAIFEQAPAEFRTSKSVSFFLTGNVTFHLKMVSASLRISCSCSGVNICACDKCPVPCVAKVPERSCLILEGVKTVKCQ